MRKVIFIFRQYAGMPNLPGGTRHFSLASELVKQGINVYIFTSNFKHFMKKRYRSFDSLFFIEEIEGVKFVSINTISYYGNGFLRFANMIDYSIKCLIVSLILLSKQIKPDIVIGSIAHIFAIMSAHFLSKIVKSRFFIDVGDLWPEAFVSSGRLSTRNPIYHILKKVMIFYYTKAEKIICITDEMAKYFGKLGFLQKVVKVPSGVCNKLISKYQKIPVRPEYPQIIYCGTFQPLHPVDKIILAAKIIQDAGFKEISFSVVGDGIQKEMLKTMVKELSVENFNFIEPVPKNEIIEVLEPATAFIIIEEDQSYGFPNKVLDYLLVGRPVIYATPAIHDKLLASECCIRSTTKPEELARSILKAISLTDDKWERMCLNGQRYITENHDIRIVTKDLINAVNL